MQKESLRAQFAPLGKFLRPYRWPLGATLIFIILQVTCNVYISRFLGSTLDSGLLSDAAGFQRAFLSLLFVWIAADIFLYCRYQLARRAAERVAYDVRQAATEHLSQLSVAEIERRHSGDYVSRLSSDIGLIKNLVAQEWANLVRGLVAFVVSLVVMLLVSWKVTLLSMAITPVLALVATALSKPIAVHTTAMQVEAAKLNALSQDATAGVIVTKAFNLRPHLSERFRTAGRRLVSESADLAYSEGKLNASMMLLSVLPFLVLFGLGGMEVMRDRLSIGQLLMLLNLLNNLTWPLQGMTQSFAQINAGLKASQRVFEVIELPVERVGGEIAVVKDTPFAIELRSVAFQYKDDAPVLSDLNLQVRPGETVAIVGSSGSGKTTLFTLLLGLRQPSQGEVRYFGQPLTSLDLASVRQLVAYVPQEPHLFPGTVAENLQYGRLDASELETVQAAKQAFAHEFITQLPDGYQTNLGEQGVGLSGGQRQRLSLARAILRDTPILLLDEATSALDTESEARVQAAIENASRDRTTLIVAHRLSTIKAVDRIFVLDRGTVAESGTHDELMALNGLYAKLYHRQVSGEDSAQVATAGQ